MLIYHHGHSEFLLEYASGFRVLTDPFDESVGYKTPDVFCDAVTMSHGHGDHACVSRAKNYTVCCDKPGATRLSPEIFCEGIPSFHDDCGGEKRGRNTIFIFSGEGLRVAHLGDLGIWDAALLPALRDVDILLMPVGGYYTMNIDVAAALYHHVQPRILIPMHYRTEANKDWPVAPVEDFLKVISAENAPRMPLLRVTAKDISQQPRVVVID